MYLSIGMSMFPIHSLFCNKTSVAYESKGLGHCGLAS
jgi:hypothetical protein